MKSLNELGKTEQELATGTFHIRLFKYLEMYLENDPEIENLNDETVFYFEMIDGRYTISLKDLREKADAETIEFLAKHNIEFNNTKDGKGNN